MTEKSTTAFPARDLRGSVTGLAPSSAGRTSSTLETPTVAIGEKRIASAAVRALCGGISDMTLWRWLNDPNLGFPKPTYIARRRYWREADVIAWLDAQSASAAV